MPCEAYFIDPGLADFVSVTRSYIRGYFVAIATRRYVGLSLTWEEKLLCFTRKGV